MRHTEKRMGRAFLWWSTGSESCLPVQGTQAQSRFPRGSWAPAPQLLKPPRPRTPCSATGESPHSVTERFKDSTARNKFGKKKELWGNFKFPNIWVVGVSEGEVMRETEKVFEEIMAPNFPHWMKTINPQISKAKWTPSTRKWDPGVYRNSKPVLKRKFSKNC